MKIKIIVFVITLSLLLSGMLVAVGGEVTDGEEGESDIEENIDSGEDRADEISYEKRLMDENDIEKMKSEVGVYQPDENYNEVIGEYGTGWTPPAEEDYQEMEGSATLTQSVNGADTLSQSVDLTTTQYFPPVGNQGQQGSCSSWSVGYYANTYLQAQAYEWDASSGNEEYLMSPSWLYNKVNGGENAGTTLSDNVDAIGELGNANLNHMPYDDSDAISWGDETAWRNAPEHRIAEAESTYVWNVDVVKSWIDSGHLASFGIDADQYSDDYGNWNIDGDTLTTDNYDAGAQPNHAQTIVGYDDAKEADGETGAFKVVNSWGADWGPHNEGTYYITYDCFDDLACLSSYALTEPMYGADSAPELIGTTEFDQTGSRDGEVELGIGDPDAPIGNVSLAWDGGSYDYPSFMAFDYTRFKSEWNEGKDEDTFFLDFSSASTSSTVQSFEIEYYDANYAIGEPDTTSGNSPDVAADTPCTVEVDFVLDSDEWFYQYGAGHRSEANDAIGMNEAGLWYGAIRVELPKSDITDIAYYDWDEPNSIKGKIYTDGNNDPDNLIAETEEYTPPGAKKWMEIPLKDTVRVDSGYYWVVMEIDDPGNGVFPLGTIDGYTTDGGWISGDGNTWNTLSDQGFDSSWALEVHAQEPPKFVTNEWSISKTTASAGETLNISGEVENTGGQEGDDTVELYVDGTLAQSQSIENLYSSENETLSFDYSEEKVGDYDIRVETEDDNWTTTLSVEPGDIDYIEIMPSSNKTTLDSGESIDFSAEAYDEYGNLITDDDTDFTWENADSSGTFDETDAGDYEVKATYNGEESDSYTVTVETFWSNYWWLIVLIVIAAVIAIVIAIGWRKKKPPTYEKQSQERFKQQQPQQSRQKRPPPPPPQRGDTQQQQPQQPSQQQKPSHPPPEPREGERGQQQKPSSESQNQSDPPPPPPKEE